MKKNGYVKKPTDGHLGVQQVADTLHLAWRSDWELASPLYKRHPPAPGRMGASILHAFSYRQGGASNLHSGVGNTSPPLLNPKKKRGRVGAWPSGEGAVSFIP